MTIKTTDISVLHAIRDKRINLVDFTEGRYHSFYEIKPINAITTIDFGWIQDNSLLQYLVNFLYDASHRNDLSPETFHAGYALYAARLAQESLDGSLNGFISFCHLKRHRGNMRTFCNAFLLFYELSKFDDPFDCDIWALSNFNLAADRVNPTDPLHYLYFTDAVREDTKVLIKKYTKYNLELTGLSVSSIFNKLRKAILVCNMIDKSPVDFTRSDALKVIENIRNSGIQDKTYNEYIRDAVIFFDYLIAYDYMTLNPFSYEDTIKRRRTYIRNSVDSSVVRAIFNCLDKFKDKNLVLIFLIEYCTGMRVSEVCQLRRNCLAKTSQGFFIKYYSQKMKKEVTNVIPENLYLMIQRHIASITDMSQEFLFVAPRIGGPYRSGTLRKAMNDELAAFDIKNPDGTPYIYRPHSYRHTMGKKMRDLDIPFQFIQEQLHHESPDMTMNYVEYMDKEKVKKYNEFIDVRGEIAPIETGIKLDNDEAHAEYMRKFINAQMLPNGVCARPVKLGSCPHCNSCLTCSEFRTSVKDLPVHKEHLLRIENYIKTAETNGWAPQVATSKATRENLLKIIAKLEEIK